MKICFAVLLAGITFVWNSWTVQAEDTCRVWQCNEQLGGDINGTARICADVSGNLASANMCQPDGSYLCNAGTQLAAQTMCSEFNPLPWKTDLAPGDTCESPNQCQSGNCNSQTSVCQGAAAAAVCASDIECGAGFSCNRGNLTCVATAPRGANCTADEKCHFGNTCVDGKCTGFGTIAAGTSFTVMENERADPAADTSAFASLLCRTFVAIHTGVVDETTNLPIYLCINGDAKQFTEYGNVEATQCKYTRDFANTTMTPIEIPAVCGYNIDGRIYCPMRRSTAEHGTQNSNDAKTWADAPTTCHIRTSIQYCKDIEGNDLRSLAFRSALQTAWKASGDNFPLVANSNRCIGNTFVDTRRYWRIVDSATTTVVSYFGLIAALFVLTLAY